MGEGIRASVPFLKVFSPNVNLTARLEFELAYYDSAVQYISHYATGTLPPPKKWTNDCYYWQQEQYYPIYPPPARAGYDTRSIFKRSLTGLNSEFSFSYTSCLTKAEEHSLPYYLPIAGGRIFGFIHFPMYSPNIIVNNIIKECSKLSLKEFKSRHEWIRKVIHWELCKSLKFKYTVKLCAHTRTHTHTLYIHERMRGTET